MLKKTDNEPVAATPKLIPDKIREILGKPPLLRSEDPAHYEKLFSFFVAESDPQTVSDWVRVKDAVDAIWETQRLRRLSGGVMDLGIRRAAIKLVLEGMSEAPREKISVAKQRVEALVGKFLAGEDTEKNLNQVLAEAGVGADALHAAAFETKAATFERVDRMVGSRIKQRDQALLNLQYSADARAARPKADDSAVEDVEKDVS